VTPPTILIAGGGTGGHVFPAVAVAEALRLLADVRVVFCATGRGIEATVVPARGWPLERLDVEPMKGRGALPAARAAALAAKATVVALGILRRVQPRAVLSVGGYAAGPTALAAVLRGVPVALLEPNCVVGMTHRLVAPFAKRAYVAWPETAMRFGAAARRVYGVPLRPGFAPRPYAPLGAPRLLVMGGSQGSAALNERLPKAVARLRGALPGLSVVHQAGGGRDGAVRAAYATEGVTDVVVAPFLDDVAAAIAAADLVVARAGAATIAEISAIGRAALLVPFPHAADDHQGRNAEAFAAAGAGVCVREGEATVDRIGREMEHILADHSARVAMADAARARGSPGAARDVAMDLLGLAGVDARGPVAVGDVVANSPIEAEAR